MHVELYKEQFLNTYESQMEVLLIKFTDCVFALAYLRQCKLFFLTHMSLGEVWVQLHPLICNLLRREIQAA